MKTAAVSADHPLPALVQPAVARSPGGLSLESEIAGDIPEHSLWLPGSPPSRHNGAFAVVTQGSSWVPTHSPSAARKQTRRLMSPPLLFLIKSARASYSSS